MSAEWSLQLTRGVDTLLTFTASVAGGSIAGWPLVWRLQDLSGQVRLLKSVGSGLTITDPVDRVYTVLLERADTVELLPGHYRFETDRADLAGAWTDLASGAVYLR